MPYEPLEDSYMMAEEVKKHANGLVLDMGTGSGFLAVTAAYCKKVKKVIALDIDKRAIQFCMKYVKNPKIEFHESDLFGYLEKNPKLKNKKFDTIVFNPPYLPSEGLKDPAIEGGKKGYEILEKFLKKVNEYLKTTGIVLILFSSLTNKERVDDIIRKTFLDFRELSRKHIFFEDLYVYLLRKNNILKNLEKKGVEKIQYLARGKRGMVFTGIYKKKKIAIKMKHPKSKAVGRIKNEAKWLKTLKKEKMTPEFLFSNKHYIAYTFAEGEFIVDFFEKSRKNPIRKIIHHSFDICRKLDLLGVDKEEMHRPVKHIIVTKKIKPVFIDFERTRKTKKPKNVTQFCQFLTSRNLEKLLKKKSFKIKRKEVIELAREYKKKPTDLNYKKILKYFS